MCQGVEKSAWSVWYFELSRIVTYQSLSDQFDVLDSK